MINSIAEENIRKDLSKAEKRNLAKAFYEGNYEVVKEIIEYMGDLDEEVKYDHKISGTALILSCQFEMVTITKRLIELGTTIEVENGNSPLMIAIQKRNFDIVQLLIFAKANVNYINSDEGSALSMAVYYYDQDIFQLLISSGVDIDKCGGKSLIGACENRNLDLIVKVIALGANINSSDLYGWTPLHYAISSCCLKVVQLLLDNGADENIKNKNGQTPIEMGTTEEIKEFVRNYKPTKYVLK